MPAKIKLFVMIEGLLSLGALISIVQTHSLLFFAVIGILFTVYGAGSKRKNSFKKFVLILGLIILSVILLSNFFIWAMLIVLLVFIGGFSDVSKFPLSKKSVKWKDPEMRIIETEEAQPKNGRRQKWQWVGNQNFGSNVYEWDDINIQILAGDTIIDLGNTLLPKEDSVILVRKGIGRTRILVPIGVGVHLEFSSLAGSVDFDKEKMQLKNESVSLFSTDYDETTRHLKIAVSTLVGDIEVISV
ncbi:MAG: cell wall-active antibiotics response protein LiaF [Lactobacillales bacterium]|jgi:predicted membrane protein|nr:cell wall-active antibiotics response protein LiaF [Lactobacillales bacterium]